MKALFRKGTKVMVLSGWANAAGAVIDKDANWQRATYIRPAATPGRHYVRRSTPSGGQMMTTRAEYIRRRKPGE